MRIYLLDANGIVAWNHYSVSDNSAHEDAEAGVIRWWNAFSSEMMPVHVVACFDCSRESNWRKKLYPEYKSGRDSKPKDIQLARAMAAMPGVFRSIGINTLSVDGFEADDLMAAMADRWSDEVVIVSADKDLRQLVDDKVTVYDPMPNKAGECVFYDPAKVLEKNHVMPDRLREVLAIWGDSSDSIPGVPGLGKVAAVTMVNQTRSKLEMVRLAKEGKLKDISPRKQSLFVEHLDDFELFYKIVGLDADAPIPEGFDTRYKATIRG